MDALQLLHIPVSKIDEAQRIVYGVAADETPDEQGEIWDYASNKAPFQTWSESVSKVTEGKSLGNIRAMHRPVAAGKVTELTFDDKGRRMLVAAKIVDDVEWEKCKEGVYTGFSVYGSYVKKWADGVNKRYTMDPMEISLVDRGSNHAATFELVKVSGTSEQIAFKVAAREDLSAADKKAATKEYGNVEFADEKNKTYPIDTPAHVRAAASYFGMPKNRAKYSEADQKSIDAKIDAAKKKFKIGDYAEAKKMAHAFASKGLWSVGDLGQCLMTLKRLQEDALAERNLEGDDSDLPERLAEVVQEVAGIYVDMAEEESAELVEGLQALTLVEVES